MINEEVLIADTFSRPGLLEGLEFFFSEPKNADLYLENPVDIETFCNSEKYLNVKDVIRPVVLEDLKALFSHKSSFGYCPYEEAVFDEAIGSGKSFKTSIIITYMIYHLLCLKSPQEKFGLDKATTIAIMNMSINAMQARKVVFNEVKQRIENSPWFQDHKPDPKINSELRFEKNIVVIPGHSGATYPLGYNLIVAVMDEAAFYTCTKDNDVAEEMFLSMKRRIKNRFDNNGLIIVISSPRYVEDFIERKMEEAEEEEKRGLARIFNRRRPIWEVLPRDIQAIEHGDFFMIGSVKIPNRYKDDFNKNPEKSWRDYGARPSLTLEPYIKQYDLVEKCIDDSLPLPFSSKENEQMGILRKEFVGDPRYHYYIHIDLALTGDAAGIAMAHKDENDEITVDLMRRITGSKEKEIDITEIKDFVIALRAKGFRLGKVTYDQYQSAQSIQQLRKKNIESEKLSVDASMEPYETLKELCYGETIRFYRHDVFLNEMRCLELIKGKKIDHPTKGSKDVSDGVAGAVHGAVEGEGVKQFKVKIV